MNLFVIGKKAKSIEALVKATLDDIQVNKYDTIDLFIQDVQGRRPTIDRLILMQDAYIDLEDKAFSLTSFNDYLQAYYPSTRLITLSNSEDNVYLLANYLISSVYAHLYFETVKNTVILAIIQEPIEEVKKKYEIPDLGGAQEVIGEVIDEDTEPNQEESVKKKKGLFGLFGRKKKSSDKDNITVAPIGQGMGVTDFSPYDSDKDYTEYEEENNSEDYEYTEDEEPYEEYSENYADDGWESNEEESINFSIESTVFGETSSEYDELGNWATNEEDYSDEEFDEQEKPFDCLSEETSVEDASLDEVISPIEEPAKKEPLNITVEPKHLYGMEDLEQDIEEDMEIESFKDDEAEYNQKIEELGKEHRIAGKNIVIPKANISKPSSYSEDLDIEEVDTDISIFDNLSDIAEKYEEANTKTIIKETIVEKVIEVEKHGVSRNYQNGVRLIIVTGDRKTGVTRTALNLASYYAKEHNTLYVDLDTNTHGSVAYLGLENIVEKPEHIQNGVGSLKNVGMLNNLTIFEESLGFSYLISFYDSKVTDEKLKETQNILAYQKEYETVIIDCPIDKLYLMEDIIIYSEVLICIESYLTCVINTLEALDTLKDKKISALMSRHCSFVLTKGKLEELNRLLGYVGDVFDLNNKVVDWSKTPLAGTIKDINTIAKEL